MVFEERNSRPVYDNWQTCVFPGEWSKCQTPARTSTTDGRTAREGKTGSVTEGVTEESPVAQT